MFKRFLARKCSFRNNFETVNLGEQRNKKTQSMARSFSPLNCWRSITQTWRGELDGDLNIIWLSKLGCIPKQYQYRKHGKQIEPSSTIQRLCHQSQCIKHQTPFQSPWARMKRRKSGLKRAAGDSGHLLPIPRDGSGPAAPPSK